MSEPRAYRAGLGLPPAIHITSSSAPPRSAHLLTDENSISVPYPSHKHLHNNCQPEIDPSRSSSSSSSSSLPNTESRPQLHPAINTLSREAVWREWNVNPSSHGPERLTRPPVFVASKLTYDELGRSMNDGVDVEVDGGDGDGKGEERDGEVKQNGEGVRDWYLSLASGPGPGPGSGSGIENVSDLKADTTKSTKVDEIQLEVDPTSSRASITTPHLGSVSKDEATGEDEDGWEIQPGPSRLRDQPARASQKGYGSTGQMNGVKSTVNDSSSSHQSSTARHEAALAPQKIVDPSKPLRVHRRDWFIRCALLTSSASSAPPSRPASTTTTSIGAMLNIARTIARPAPPVQYVLGPDNKGYEILRDRLGWQGGGLGRPEGWQGDPMSRPIVARTKDNMHRENERDVGRGGSKIDGTVMEIDPNGHPVVDLTVSSEEDSADFGSDRESDFDPPPTMKGPGRTAPIATTLKFDRLGLGHRLSSSVQKSREGVESTRKKVTHTDKEIRQAQRRGMKHQSSGGGVELGKKGKIKWKEKNRKERDDRRRLAAALNS
ncbi:hypothetical protein IAR55_003934 [Kwoniella newhampshirensis]|uniref:G-patch domain-containing protein n=1 Tax=Kwoniella newhampshirensis TaxID=1651941 RepID=A0AAW0YYI8_9TREE